MDYAVIYNSMLVVWIIRYSTTKKQQKHTLKENSGQTLVQSGPVVSEKNIFK
jgi:hypothetical protein